MLNDRLVAHRGYQKHYPENTLLAYQKALDEGAHFIETDILFSAEGEPVLYHDVTLNRVSGIQNLVHALPLDKLIQTPAYEPERLGEQFKNITITPLSALVELLQTNPATTAFIEIKRAGIEILGIEKVFNTVVKALKPVQEQCVLISFSDEFIEYAHQQKFPRLGLVLKEWEALEQGLISDIKPEFVFCDIKKIPPNRSLDTIESTTVVYDIEDPDEAILWFNRGADMIETFDIGGMISNLASRAL